MIIKYSQILQMLKASDKLEIIPVGIEMNKGKSCKRNSRLPIIICLF